MSAKTTISTSWFGRRFGEIFHKFDHRTRVFVKHSVDSVFVQYHENEKENCCRANNNGSAAASSRSKIIGLFFVPVAGVGSSIKYLNEDITEDLKELYLKNDDRCCEELDKQFEIVQICFPHRPLYLGDIVAEDMKNEFENRCMNVPWFALPYEEIERNVRIRHYYNIRDGEFALVLLDAVTGKLITRQGYDKFLEDRSGKLFPWTSSHVLQILETIPRYVIGSETGSKDQTTIDLATCSFQDIDCDAIIGLYFSAHWCPPCKAFTSQLINTYKAIKEKGHKFEIILISSDRSADSYSHYVSKIPWLAIPYEDSDSRNQLTALYGIQGIPSLVLLNTDGSLITEDGRGEVNEDPDGTNFPWYPKLVNILTPRMAAKLQKNPAVVLFTDGEDVEIELATAVLTPVSEYTRKKYDDLLLFFIAIESDTSESVREYLGLEDVSPLLTLIDTSLGRYSVMEYGKEITEKSIINFISQFYNNELIFLPIDRPL